MPYVRDDLDDAPWPALRPIMGIIFALLVSGGIAAARPPSPALAYRIGEAAGIGAVLLALAWLVALRRASMGWRIVGAVLIAAMPMLLSFARAGELANIARVRGEMAGVREDASALLNGQEVKGGDDTTPAGVVRNLLAAKQADQRAMDAALLKSGAMALIDPDKLRRDSSVLGNCGAVEGLLTLTRQQRDREGKRIEQVRERLKRMETDRSIARGMLEGLEASLAQNGPDHRRRWELSEQMTTELAGMCRILARRNWRFQGGMLGFTTNRDMNAYNGAIDRYNSALLSLRALEEDMTRRAQVALARMKDF